VLEKELADDISIQSTFIWVRLDGASGTVATYEEAISSSATKGGDRAGNSFSFFFAAFNSLDLIVDIISCDIQMATGILVHLLDQTLDETLCTSIATVWLPLHVLRMLIRTMSNQTKAHLLNVLVKFPLQVWPIGGGS
jgi:hypothetical protein